MDLIGGRLAHIQNGLSLQVMESDFFIHRAPPLRWERRLRLAAAATGPAIATPSVAFRVRTPATPVADSAEKTTPVDGTAAGSTTSASAPPAWSKYRCWSWIAESELVRW